MKIKKIIGLFIFAIACCSCSSMFNSSTVLMQIQKGMSSDEVVRLLGQPKFRNFVDKNEDWVYEKIISLELTVIVVTFDNNKVIKMESFRGEDVPPAYVAQLPPPPVIVAPPIYIEHGRPQYPNNQRVVVMNNDQFQSLYNNIRKKSFKDDKLDLLSIGVSNRYLTCDQCIRLMRLFSFDDERLSVVRIVAPRIVDRENCGRVIDVLSFISSKEEAKRIFETPLPPLYSRNPPRAMMNDAFESFYRQIKSKPFKDERFSLLSIGIGGNYFTCRQCVRLMSLFSFDDEKIKVLNIVAPHLIDRENARVIIESLSFKSSEDEARRILSRR